MSLRLSPSIAKVLTQKSPLHAYQAATRDRSELVDRSEALRFGAAVDRLVFGVGDEIVIKTKRGEKEQPGTILIKQADFNRAHQVRLAVCAAVPRLADPVLSAKGSVLHQAKYVWNNGIECSAKPDQVDLAMETVNDLKTARDLSDLGVMSAIEDYGYHIQMAAYEEAVRVKYGWPQPLMRLVFVEKQAPYEVRVVRMEAPALERLRREGKELWQLAIKTWKECIATDTWPGRGDLDTVKIKPSKTELNNWNNS